MLALFPCSPTSLALRKIGDTQEGKKETAMGVMCVLCAVTNRFSLVLHILQGRSQGGGGGGGGVSGL